MRVQPRQAKQAGYAKQIEHRRAASPGRGRSRWVWLMLALVTAVSVGFAAPASAQMVPAPPPLEQDQEHPGRTTKGDLPQQFEGAGVTQKLESQLPLNMTFVDSKGKTVKLGDYFTGEKPVILNMGYYDCPALCPMIWRGMRGVFNKMDWSVGEQFEVVTISFDPAETPELAAEKKQEILARLNDTSAAAEGWHFLTGKAGPIERVAKASGFGYKPVQEDSEFAHQAAIMVISPEGKVMQYFGGVAYDPFNLKMSMMDASEGKTGSLMDKLAQFCCSFNPDTGDYELAMGAMRIGGGVTVAALVVGIGVMIRIGRRRRATAAMQADQDQ